jgi:hypothetical protein
LRNPPLRAFIYDLAAKVGGLPGKPAAEVFFSLFAIRDWNLFGTHFVFPPRDQLTLLKVMAVLGD